MGTLVPTLSKCSWAPTQSQTWVTTLTAFLGALQLLSTLQGGKLRPQQAKGMVKAAQLGTGAGTTLGGLTLTLGPVTQLWDRDQRKGPVGKDWPEGVTGIRPEAACLPARGTGTAEPLPFLLPSLSPSYRWLLTGLGNTLEPPIPLSPMCSHLHSAPPPSHTCSFPTPRFWLSTLCLSLSWTLVTAKTMPDLDLCWQSH